MSFKLNIENKKTINKCVRFPTSIIEKVEKIANKNNVSFSKFVIEACSYALENLDEEKEQVSLIK